MQNPVLPGTIIHSEGYPSYPRSKQNDQFYHKIVYRSKGFGNARGDHTILLNRYEKFLKMC